MLDVKSIAFGPTIKQYIGILDNLRMMAMGDDRAYYKKDSGPYSWNAEGQAKIKNQVMRMIALSGGTADPAMAMKNLQGVQTRK